LVRFGAFIITYRRPSVLLETINSIFSQTYPPELVWIIDNSENVETGKMVASMLDSRVNYFYMGYNSGPAGAAAKGLELCGKAGLDWIYWGDDNDPPFRVDCFERLLAIKNVNPFCGILGSVGQYFDRNKGKILRVQTRLLEKKPWIEVDYVAGGMCMLVSGEVARAGIAPDPKLFFGFEELDFCLKVKRKGYSLVVDCGLFLEARAKHGRLGFERPLYQKKTHLVREYYSLRNLLYISDSVSLPFMRRNLYKKWTLKAVYGFRYGPVYGWKNMKMISLAFWHYWKGNMGKTLNLRSE
jgi:GT2 family glycosyltransferase